VKRERRRRSLLPAFPILALGLAVASTASAAPRTLEDYRYFRALSIDLQGRIPTRAELAELESDSFDIDAWIDQRLEGPGYAERVRRVYMDLLRLEIDGTFQFTPGVAMLRRKEWQDPNGKAMIIYFREGQRRTRTETDGTFCLTQAETGLQFPRNAAPTGTPKVVTQAVLDANTVVVKPWWLYRDYRAASPKDLYDPATWAEKFPSFIPANGLLKNPDMTPTTEIRICKEEAQKAAEGTVYTTGLVQSPAAGEQPPYGRLTHLPRDSKFAQQNAGKPISCAAGTALANSADCGCGPGLERCMPATSAGNDPVAFALPTNAPLGLDKPFDLAQRQQSWWSRTWWGEEATHFFDDIFLEDRDFREVLTSRATVVNGPLTQFYSSIAHSTCCGNGTYFGYAEPQPLFDPKNLPKDLLPHDTNVWMRVEDRGPYASGLLTMPIFLTKYGSRRARAHVLYNAFLCREFVSEDAELTPSTDPDLTSRAGCADCHATLEPLASYFSRIVESEWTYLPPEQFPAKNPYCKTTNGKIRGECSKYYDPAFANDTEGTLRGAYASLENAEAGPSALAEAITESSDFPSCVARNIASSFLGRPLSADDAALQEGLAEDFMASGYRVRAIVGALVKSDAYRRANNMSGDTWRNGGEP
jgi:hypothetical protein